jgi:hypothetical protein
MFFLVIVYFVRECARGQELPNTDDLLGQGVCVQVVSAADNASSGFMDFN